MSDNTISLSTSPAAWVLAYRTVYSTLNGQKIVMRVLNRSAKRIDIRESGMSPRVMERFLEEALDVPSGVILITGPTGSGKTTTLYGAVNYLNNDETCIVTAEDPVEYIVDGIAQCSINPQINVTFEETLRSMVRQDPDVLVLGEIRDRFSAEAAIQAIAPNFAKAAIIAENDARIETSAYENAASGIKGYLAAPKGMKAENAGNFAIVIHENRGLNPHIQDVARRAAPLPARWKTGQGAVEHGFTHFDITLGLMRALRRRRGCGEPCRPSCTSPRSERASR